MTSNAPAAITPAPAARQLSPYSPGVDPAPIDLRLDRNERATPPAEIAAAFADCAPSDCAAYPDKQPLERALAEVHGLPAAQVIVTAGGDDAIDRCCRAMLTPGTTLLMHAPSFEMIDRSARIAGGSVRALPWLEGSFPVDAMAAAITPDTRMVALVTPNNPTGMTIDLEAIAQLAHAAPHAVILLDLAYIEFADEADSFMARALASPNVLAVRTFSKAYGLAGMRIGWAAGSADIINWLRAVGGPYPTSALGLRIAGRLLAASASSMQPYIQAVREERAQLTTLLKDAGWDAWPSQANFVLARSPNAADLREALAQRGIAVRAFAGPSELTDCLRITCPGDRASFDRLVAALTSILPSLKGAADA